MSVSVEGSNMSHAHPMVKSQGLAFGFQIQISNSNESEMSQIESSNDEIVKT
jgi:hypothetical protein